MLSEHKKRAQAGEDSVMESETNHYVSLLVATCIDLRGKQDGKYSFLRRLSFGFGQNSSSSLCALKAAL